MKKKKLAIIKNRVINTGKKGLENIYQNKKFYASNLISLLGSSVDELRSFEIFKRGIRILSSVPYGMNPTLLTLRDEVNELIRNGKTNQQVLNDEIVIASYDTLSDFIEKHRGEYKVIHAMKKIFLSTLTPGLNDGQKISKKLLIDRCSSLQSFDITVLTTCYKLVLTGVGEFVHRSERDAWLNRIKDEIHETIDLEFIKESEERLIKHKLLEEAIMPENTIIRHTKTARLTSMGMSLIKIIEDLPESPLDF